MRSSAGLVTVSAATGDVFLPYWIYRYKASVSNESPMEQCGFGYKFPSAHLVTAFNSLCGSRLTPVERVSSNEDEDTRHSIIICLFSIYLNSCALAQF